MARLLHRAIHSSLPPPPRPQQLPIPPPPPPLMLPLQAWQLRWLEFEHKEGVVKYYDPSPMVNTTSTELPRSSSSRPTALLYKGTIPVKVGRWHLCGSLVAHAAHAAHALVLRCVLCKGSILSTPWLCAANSCILLSCTHCSLHATHNSQ